MGKDIAYGSMNGLFSILLFYWGREIWWPISEKNFNFLKFKRKFRWYVLGMVISFFAFFWTLLMVEGKSSYVISYFLFVFLGYVSFSRSDEIPYFIKGILALLIPPALFLGPFTLFDSLGFDFPIEVTSVNEFDLIISLALFYGVNFYIVNEYKKTNLNKMT